MASAIPDDCPQYLVDPWWIQDDSKTLECGRLLHAYVHHVDLTPLTMVPEERSDPKVHDRALFKLEQMRIHQQRGRSRLPVAALPQNPGEVYAVHRAKVRPVIVVACDWQYPKPHPAKPTWQTSPTMLVAPYYGVGVTDQRAGWDPEFVARVRHGEYPQYLWDHLPIDTGTTDSILRLDHLMPVGMHHDSYQLTEHRLSEDAMGVFREWIEWALFGTVDVAGPLAEIRSVFEDLEGS